MLNPKTQERELCYVVEINDIQPIPNYDRVELATVNGWHIIVQKNQFKVGDKAIYFEVDSKVPESAEFDFLAKRKYKIKTLKRVCFGMRNFKNFKARIMLLNRS